MSGLSQDACRNHDDRLILYVDLLGVSAVTDKEHDLLNLLYTIQKLTSQYSESDQQDPNDPSKRLITLSPEFSAFSDHIVVSYPINTLDSIPCPLGIFLLDALRVITPIAFRALDLGFLIRGGLTIGKLYHDARVVCGAGLVEAYAIESSVAIYPRIALSLKLQEQLSSDDCNNYLTQDKDGVWHLNYFRHMCHQAISKNSYESGTNARDWKLEAFAIIENNINRLNTESMLKEAAKWAWFKKCLLLLLVSSIPGSLKTDFIWLYPDFPTTKTLRFPSFLGLSSALTVYVNRKEWAQRYRGLCGGAEQSAFHDRYNIATTVTTHRQENF